MVKNPSSKRLLSLFVPIFFETLFLMLAGTVDTLMLSSVGDDAVGAVGTANSYLSMFFIAFTVISSGLIAVMTQYIGAGKKGIAIQARRMAVLFNGIMGVALSFALGFGADWIVSILQVSDGLKTYAATYIRIIGSGCILNALIPVFSVYLRAFNRTKYAILAALIGNVVNLVMNSLFLFVWHLDVMGVAFGTIIGRIVNLVLCMIFGKVLVSGRQYPERIPNKELLSKIIRVGLPAAAESAFYFVAMGLVTMFLNQMDKTGYNATARSYANQVTNFSYCAAAALAQANAIVTGWSIGEDKIKECYPATRNAALIGVGIGVGVELIVALISPWLLKIFTTDTGLITTVQIVLYIDIALEIGRASNLIYGQTLKATGDSIYPAMTAIAFNFLGGVGGAYLFGIVLKMGVVGAYIGLALDECGRAIFMFFRWQSGKWESKVLIRQATKRIEQGSGLERRTND